MTQPNPRDEIRNHYEHRIREDLDSYAVLDWASSQSQRKRFAVLVEQVDLNGRSLLDVGCGLGDLYAYLRQRELDVDYTGVDLLERMSAEARRRNPGGSFVTADPFGQANPFGRDSFDVVFCSGIFNLNLGNNLQFLPVAASRLMEITSALCVVNLLHARAADKEDRYFYYDPAAVKAMWQPLAENVRVVEDYLPNDFTLIARK